MLCQCEERIVCLDGVEIRWTTLHAIEKDLITSTVCHCRKINFFVNQESVGVQTRQKSSGRLSTLKDLEKLVFISITINAQLYLN